MTHTTPDAPTQRTARHLVAREVHQTWLPEAAIALGAVAAATGALLPAFALPCAATGLLVVAGGLTARIRFSRVPAEPAAAPAPVPAEADNGADLRIRMRAHLRDVALTAGLHDGALRVYRRTELGFVRIDTADAQLAEANDDQYVLAAAWQNAVARLPVRSADEVLTLVAVRIDDRHSNGPIALVVIAPRADTAGEEAIRRARGSDSWARLSTFLETAALALTPNRVREPVG